MTLLTYTKIEAGGHAVSADKRYVIYRWLTSDKFMVHGIVPGASVIEAGVNDEIDDIMDAMPEDASAFHFHLNCTLTARFPKRRDELMKRLRDRGILVVNADLTDISKQTIQRRLGAVGLNTTTASAAGDPEQLIIVKTNLNFGGDSEWAFSEDDRSNLGIGKGSDIIWKPDDYRVIPRREVDASWWSDPSLVCERYVDNAGHLWYRAMVLFSRIVLRALVNESQIKKVASSVITHTWNLSFAEIEHRSAEATFPDNVARDIVRFAREFHIDYGGLDIMLDDAGRPYIIDVNSTPSYLESTPAWLAFLAGALANPSRAEAP